MCLGRPAVIGQVEQLRVDDRIDVADQVAVLAGHETDHRAAITDQVVSQRRETAMHVRVAGHGRVGRDDRVLDVRRPGGHRNAAARTSRRVLRDRDMIERQRTGLMKQTTAVEIGRVRRERRVRDRRSPASPQPATDSRRAGCSNRARGRVPIECAAVDRDRRAGVRRDAATGRLATPFRDRRVLRERAGRDCQRCVGVREDRSAARRLIRADRFGSVLAESADADRQRTAAEDCSAGDRFVVVERAVRNELTDSRARRGDRAAETARPQGSVVSERRLKDVQCRIRLQEDRAAGAGAVRQQLALPDRQRESAFNSDRSTVLRVAQIAIAERHADQFQRAAVTHMEDAVEIRRVDDRQPRTRSANPQECTGHVQITRSCCIL